MKKLVIVESPTKSKTVGKYLSEIDPSYSVMASVGHIRELAKSGPGGLGVDIENGFKPTYKIDPKKAKIAKEIIAKAKKVDEVILATDPDREGEAIAWHLAEVLNLDVATTKRLEIHEITRDGVIFALENARHIDMNMKASQEARRILDRISGFKLSKLLQKKIKSKSAGRVQSVTLKLIVDREREIEAFIPEEYWSIRMSLSGDNKNLDVNLLRVDGEKVDLKTKESTEKIISRIGSNIPLTNVKKSERKRESKAPFTTSTMLQEAKNKLGMSPKKSSSLAQKLFEGITLKDETVGLITYLRTDSTRLSPIFVGNARAFISDTFGPQYVSGVEKSKKVNLSQDAHEAIRPTSPQRKPASVKAFLDEDEFRLYQLIYNRALASLMSPRKDEVTNYTFEDWGLTFSAEGYVTLFDGFSVLYPILEDGEATNLPYFKQGSVLKVEKVNPEQHFTKAPPRYTESKIIEAMETIGIGRPSTYSSTIETIKSKVRDYVTIEGGGLKPTVQGISTVDYLTNNFHDFMDFDFTSKMESKLDEIQSGNNSSSDLLSSFYYPFIDLVKTAETSTKVEEGPNLGPCPLCGEGHLINRTGKFGRFVGCSRYPECKYIQKEPREGGPAIPPEPVGRPCPVCGHPLVTRHKKKDGKPFVACSDFPRCKFIEGAPERFVKPAYKKKK